MSPRLPLRPQRAAVLAALGCMLGPVPAAACATCLEAAYGDRGFNLALLGLMLMPFAVAAVIGGVIAWSGVGRRAHSRDALEEEPRC